MIKNKALKDYIRYQLDKTNDYFSEFDFEKINEVYLDYNDTLEFDFSELLDLVNLNDLTLCNFNITNDNLFKILLITELKKLTLNNCILNDSCIVLGSLSLESLSLNNCTIPNYDFVYLIDELKSLSITNGIIDIMKLNRLRKLEALDIANSKILNLDKKIELDYLNKLYIDSSSINNLDIISDLNNLKELSIDNNQYDSNKEVVDKLINKNIKIVYDGIPTMNEGDIDA